MSKYFECKACKEKFNVNMESSNKGYCHVCNEFFMKKQLAELKAENESLKVQIPTFDYKAYENDLEEIVRTLQQKLKEKDEEIERLKSELNSYTSQRMKDYSLLEDYKQKIGTLEYKIKEKDDKIEHLKSIHYYRFDFKDRMSQTVAISDEMLKIITKQVCEKIRERYNLVGKPITDAFGDTQYGYVMVSAKDLNKFLDKIEKGEANDQA